MTRFEFYLNLNKYKDKQDEKNEENSLQHYGTLGQKWGQRKWQNPDGTFNEAGKERYFGKNKKAHPEDEKDELTNKRLNDIKKFYSGETSDQYEIKEGPNGSRHIIPKDQKIGAMGIYDIAAAVISTRKAIDNYGDVQALRKSYGDFMDSSDKDYSDDDRTSIMNNKKKIAQMQEALETNDQEKYNKLLKKVKDKDMEAVKKFLEDYNEKNNKATKMPEDTQEKLEESVEKLGSISKPKIPKKFLNEDGTLNERGRAQLENRRKASDVASSLFLALKNFNLFELASLPVAGAVLALAGFGVPAVIASAIAGAAMAPGIAIDNALYKKLEKRADAYYNMLSK